MKYFLQKIAEKILQDPCYQSDKSIIVFPNRRAGLFLRKHLKTSKQTFIMPQIVGMDDFVSMTSGMKIVKNEFLLFELFRIHKEISKTTGNDKYQTFEDFIPFADMILKDFSDIDLHLVNAKQLYSLLYDEKKIGEWDISNPDQLSEFQRKYLEFYHSLYDYYTQLQNRLTEANKAYSAMIYRNVAENIDTYADTMLWEKVMFVGFCEISQSEYTIIENLKRRGMAEVMMDGDRYYYPEPHEAGEMLRRFKGLWKKDDKELPENFGEEKKEFTFVSCPEKILQSEYVGNIIKIIGNTKRDKDTDPFEDTAIVLCDENLLIPTLNALPTSIDKVNITMGFPYTQTLTHNLLLSFLELYENRNKNDYHAKTTLRFLGHKFIENFLGTSNLQSQLTKQFAKDKIFYISGNELLDKVLELKEKGLAFLFTGEEIQPANLIKLYKDLCIKLYHRCNNYREQISLATSYEIFDHFAELQEIHHFADTISILRKIYQRIASCIRLSFKGEPLKGLQIMGLQETKNIDFRNIILVSCNEGVTPKGNSHNSLIPFNLRQAFGMFTYMDRDAAEAYNFFRMLQRSKKVFFTYSTDSEGVGKGEPSRFLVQIKKELVKRYPNITLTEKTLTTTQTTDSKTIITHKDKDASMMKLLKEMAESGHGFSPSALNTYRKCSLRYYYESVLGIKPSAELEEDIDTSELGTNIHKVLENIFLPFKGKDIKADELPDKKEIEIIVEQHFNENVFKNSRKESGENYFMLSVAKTQIEAFIEEQKKFLADHECKLIDVEDKLEYNLLFDNGLSVKLHGVADRIDKVDGRTRICDYKSGSVKETDLILEKEDKISDKFFQVMQYSWMYAKKYNINTVEAGIFPLQNLRTFYLPAVISGNGTVFGEEQIQLFEKHLKTLVSDIFDKNHPFEQNTKNCQFCPFTNICGVEVKIF